MMDQIVSAENQGERLSVLVDEPKRRSRAWSDFAERTLGAVLCTAAILKRADSFNSPDESGGMILAVVGTAVEVVIGVALLLRFRPSISVPAASLFFALMAGVAWFDSVTGAASCGCFGPVEVAPRVMLLFDVGAVATLLWGLRGSGAFSQQRTVALLATCVVGFLISVGVVSVVQLKQVSQTAAVSPVGIAAGGTTLLESDLRLAQPFILLPYIEIDAELSQGEWKIIFANSECRTCKQVLRGGGCKPEGQERVAVILVNRDEGWTLYKECQAVLGRLVPGKNWNISTPRTFRLSHGRLSRIM